jgi:hypothetical protein
MIVPDSCLPVSVGIPDIPEVWITNLLYRIIIKVLDKFSNVKVLE